jgi:alpha/beta superfamily hydrolase
MPPSADLPHPPEHPELPPEVRIPGEEELFFTTEDGVSIEARACLPSSAVRVALLCHPHPLYGATLHNALVVVVAKRLLERGQDRVGWLRLNFRGVGKSSGTYDGGKGEVYDVRAALGTVHGRLPRARISLVGFSFGTGVGYRAATIDGGVDRVSLIAPLPRLMRDDVGEYAGPLQVVAPSEDEFCTVEEYNALAQRLGASLSVISGADHQFIRFRRELASLVVPFVAPELSP